MFKIVQICCFLFIFKNIIYPDIAVTAVPSPSNQTSSTCYGGFFNVTCGTGKIIGIHEITVGVKMMSSGCPEVWSSSIDQSCCKQADMDCLFSFDSNAELKFHNSCNGKSDCTAQRADWDATPENCKNDSVNKYFNYSNYMFIDYDCVERTHIFDMFETSGTKETVRSETVYIWSQNYPNDTQQNDRNETACSIEIDNCDANIEIFTLDIRLFNNSNAMCEQFLKIMDADNQTIAEWNCLNDTVNINTVSTPVPSYVIVYFEKYNSDIVGRFWIGFHPTLLSNITVNCPPEYPTMCDSTTSTSTSTSTMKTSTTTSTTTTQTTTSTTTAPTTTSTTTTQTATSTTTTPTTTSTTTTPTTTSTTTLPTTTSTKTTPTTTSTTTTPTTTSTTTAPTTTSTTTTAQSSTSTQAIPSSSSSTTTHLSTINSTLKTTTEDSNYDLLLIVIGVLVGIIVIIIIILLILYRQNCIVCPQRRKIYQDNIECDDQHRYKDSKLLPTAETVSEVESQIPAQFAINAAQVRPETSHKTKFTPSGNVKRGGGAVSKRKKKENPINANNIKTDIKDNNKEYVITREKKRKSSNRMSVNTNVQTKEAGKPMLINTEYPPSNDHIHRTRPSSSRSISTISRQKSKERVLPIRASKTIPILNDSYDEVRSRPMSAKRSYQRERRRLHKKHQGEILSTKQQGSYPRPYHDLCSYSFEETDSSVYSYDMTELGKEPSHYHVRKASQRSRHNKKKGNRIKPKHSNLRHRGQNKPVGFLDRDINQLLGMIANYDRNWKMPRAGKGQGLVRYKAVNDLSNIKKPRMMSRKKVAPVYHDVIIEDGENKVIVDGELQENGNVTPNSISRRRRMKISARKSAKKTQTESFKTTFKSFHNSPKLIMKSKRS